MQEATLNTTRYENKKKSSLSIYTKLQQKSKDKMQLLTICFDNKPSSALGIYHTQKHSLRHIN